MPKPTRVLLIVCITVAAVGFPSMHAASNRGESAAIKALQFINVEEMVYNSNYPQHGFACSLAALGGSAQSGPATPEAAQLIDPELASGHKYGYTFAISNCLKFTIKGQDQTVAYKLTAVPDVVGKSGERGYCTNENGQIMFDPKGGTDCTQELQ